ncbi:hypothetical protein R1sor_017585 [Riccia sorocarpa]|uniref:Uncharacterized protein n=1 Tax=Riccia sorocarpa TaxID=122646 RepID=A0ABD3I7K9_9MARC
MQREGMLLYTFYGAADLKNRIELNPSNIMQRALQYNKYVSHHPLGTSFHGCIRRMLVGGHYRPFTSWLINRGLQLQKTNVLEDLQGSDHHDSDHSSFNGERLSGNAAVHAVTEFASFIPLVAGDPEPDRDSSDPSLEGIGRAIAFC